MSLPQPVKRFTPAEYYELERVADYKSDYYRGEIFAMSGGSARHSLITGTLQGMLYERLKNSRQCTPYESNLRLKIMATGLRTYPDASIYCEKLQVDPEDPFSETYVNPTAVFEVLSPSTELYDRKIKARSYRQIESLRVFGFIAQDEPHVELSVRSQSGKWEHEEYAGLEAVVALPMIDVQLPLTELYYRVSFTAE